MSEENEIIVPHDISEMCELLFQMAKRNDLDCVKRARTEGLFGESVWLWDDNVAKTTICLVCGEVVGNWDAT